MQPPINHAPRLYIGAPIEHDSERVVLQRVVDLLANQKRASVILANVSLRSRQIDLIVALKQTTLVIEAKAVTRPIRGNQNGPWRVQVASGGWKDFRNPYLQARDAALTVRDALRSFVGTAPTYPTASVVLVPRIPDGSNVYAGDFKVSVIDLQGLEAELSKQQTEVCSLDRWASFAAHHHLTRVSTVETACNPALLESEDILRQYLRAFLRDIPTPHPFVPFPCRSDGKPLSSHDVLPLIVEQRMDVLLCGPSGCGKTLLATQVGITFTESGGVPLYIPARYYLGDFGAALDREVGILVNSDAQTVLRAARLLNRPLLFIVDGYNECVASERSSLTRGLAAIARKYEANVFVTSQVPIERSHLLSLCPIDVLPADLATKTAIAQSVEAGTTPSPKLAHLLRAVSTGLEARLLGEVGRLMQPDSSTQALFDVFARKRLGNAETEGVLLLSQIAGRLCDAIAFTLSRRDVDRLVHQIGCSAAVATQVLNSGLLIQRADRVHFVHELFLDAFAAEQVVRRASGRPGMVLEALSAPRHAGRKGFILGAIDDPVLLDQVLDQIEDSVSVASCLSGACGRTAQAWAKKRCAALWELLRSEVTTASFCISIESRHNVAFDDAALTRLTASQRAFLDAMPRLLLEGDYLAEALDTVQILDQRMAEAESRLREQAPHLNISLRSALFATSYVFPSDQCPAISHIFIQLHRSYYGHTSDTVARTARRVAADNTGSPGQLYLLLMLTRGTEASMPLMMYGIKSLWSKAPFHLRLDLMDAAYVSSVSENEDRAALIAAIEGLPATRNVFTSSMIISALQRLGALESSERDYITVVRNEIRECLAGPDDAERCKVAFGLYSSQFDHPYCGAYVDGIEELPTHDRKTLLMMAASGCDDSSSFLNLLLLELASFGDPRVAESLARWAGLPPPDSVMPQGDVAVFLIAHIGLARFGYPLPAERGVVGGDDGANAMFLCGEILYWCNRHDLDEVSGREKYRPLLDVLVRGVSGAALDAVHHCERALVNGVERLPGPYAVVWSIVKRFPDESAELCRGALADPASLGGYFGHYRLQDREYDLKFAIEVLAQYGDSTDCRLLQKYADDAALGTSAIAAVRAIEGRLPSE